MFELELGEYSLVDHRESRSFQRFVDDDGGDAFSNFLSKFSKTINADEFYCALK
jgi:hypothetical protein